MIDWENLAQQQIAEIQHSLPEPIQYFEVKTEHSIDDVPVDPEVLEILHGFNAHAKSRLWFHRASIPSSFESSTFEKRRDEADTGDLRWCVNW